MFGGARTPAIPDARGRALAGSIARLERVTLGGVPQWITLRGHRADAPLLLVLAGGPGASQMPWIHACDTALERAFVVVHWDQPGAGRTWRAVRDAATLTVERYVRDAVALAELLCARFARERLLLVGHSWGSVLAALVARRIPHRVQALVGVAQQVDADATDRLGWERAAAAARAAGDDATARRLVHQGPPPYAGRAMLARWRTLVSAQVRHGGTAESRAREALVQRRARAAPEHSWFDRLHATRAMERTFARVYPQLAALDLARDVPRLDVPVTLALSPHDLVVPPDAAVRWLASLEAPRTSLVWFERSGHVPQVSEAEKFAGMLEEVLGTALRA